MPSGKKRQSKAQRDGRHPSASGATAEEEIEEEDVEGYEQEDDQDEEDVDHEEDLATTVERLRRENEELKRQHGPPGTGMGRGGTRMGATTGGFGTRSAYDSGGYVPQLSTYKLGTLKLLPPNTPVVESLADIYRLRSFLLHWMGPRSFILRCAPAEQALQKPSVRKVHEEKWRRFEEEHSSASMDNMQTVLSATRTIQIGRLKKNILMGDLLFLGSCLHVSP